MLEVKEGRRSGRDIKTNRSSSHETYLPGTKMNVLTPFFGLEGGRDSVATVTLTHSTLHLRDVT